MFNIVYPFVPPLFFRRYRINNDYIDYCNKAHNIFSTAFARLNNLRGEQSQIPTCGIDDVQTEYFFWGTTGADRYDSSFFFRTVFVLGFFVETNSVFVVFSHFSPSEE